MVKYLKNLTVCLLMVCLLIPQVSWADSSGSENVVLSRFQVLDGVLYLDMYQVPKESNVYRDIIVYDDNGGYSIHTNATTGITKSGVVGNNIKVQIKKNGVLLGEYNWINHDHKSSIKERKATCLKAGYKTYTCSQGCDGIRHYYYAKLPHKFQHYKKVDSTCTKVGKHYHRCVNGCNKVTTKDIAKKPHKAEKCVKTVKSTCKVKGYKLYRCKVCKNNYKSVLKLGSHNYKCIKHVKATDSKNGYKKYKCSVCSKTYTKTLCTGYVGTINSSSLGLKVKVYQSTKTSPYVDPQTLCDRKNSASGIQWSDGQYLIADHNNQGFSKLNNAKVNKTTLTYKGKTYKCYKSFKGHNTGSDLTTWDGESIRGMNNGGLTLYTCLDNWKNVRITFWKKI